VEEFYVITWESTKEQIFEMPTGGAAIMRKGPNLLKFARKEQCLALTTQLRTKFKFTPCFYRVYPSGEVQYLHPKDGVYPEKVNAGRQGVNQNFRRIGENVNPIKVRRSSSSSGGCRTDGVSAAVDMCVGSIGGLFSSGWVAGCKETAFEGLGRSRVLLGAWWSLQDGHAWWLHTTISNSKGSSQRDACSSKHHVD
jgi:photosystem I subunit 2